MRFHELAKEFGVESKKLIKLLAEEGVVIKSHMSTIDEKQEKQLRKFAASLPKSATTPEKKKSVKAPAKKAKSKKVEPEVKEEPEEKVYLVKKKKKVVEEEPVKPVKVAEEEPVKVAEVKKVPKEEKPAAPVEEVSKKEKKTKKLSIEEIARQEVEAEVVPEPVVEAVEEPKKPEPETKPEVDPEAETAEEPEEAELKTLDVHFPLSVKDLAEHMDVKPNVVISKLMGYGVFATITQNLDKDTASVVAQEFGFQLTSGSSKKSKQVEEEIEEEIPLPFETEDDPKDLLERAPVVTILGHVDHGKTSLLDKIREANVVASEKGGITQHIGAYHINYKGHPITFLDTPGHAAFTAMRARGAQVTDIAILVVAADDGLMPQTEEAISHAQDAGVPMIIAINKMDLPGANPDRIKQQLAEKNLATEDWGGEVIAVPVSAINGDGIDSLLEMILLQAEMLELKANPNRLAYGNVIEAKLTPGRGPVVTALIRKGTLKVGDYIVSDHFNGKVKAMIDDLDNQQKSVGPSYPVEVLGLNGVPEPGMDLFACGTEKEAKFISEKRSERIKNQELKSKSHVTLEDMFDQISAGEVKGMNIIVKTDVQGTLEAIKKSLLTIESDKIKLKVVHGGAGDITESDVMLASASQAVIIGFHTKAAAKVVDLAKQEGVEIRIYEIIYQIVEDVRKAMEGLLEPTFSEKLVGQAQVRQTFKISKTGTIAGCYVTDGNITRQSIVKLKRQEEIIFEGKLASLKRFKDEVKEVKSGFECGIRLADFDKIQEDDVIEAYVLEKQETLL